MHEHTKHQKKAKRKTTNICRNKNLQRWHVFGLR
jgi:hypothetical protein